MHIGKRVIELRKQYNISRSALAKQSRVALSFLNSIERGEKEPTVHTISRICTALGITLADFFAEEAPAMPPEVSALIREAKELSPEQVRQLTEFIKTVKG